MENKHKLIFHVSLTYRSLVLVKNLIVLGHGNAENYRRYVFETVYPFFTLAPLATNIEQSEDEKKKRNLSKISQMQRIIPKFENVFSFFYFFKAKKMHDLHHKIFTQFHVEWFMNYERFIFVLDRVVR